MSRAAGSLVVVGTGIQLGGQITVEALDAIRRADCVPYFVADTHAARWIESLNPHAENLARLYAPGKPRLDTYREAVEHIVGLVRAGHRVCTAFYGHPGVFAYPGHEAVARVRAAGLPARMLPAVSALDCLVADLGLDPGQTGLQSYEATHFLQREPPVDAHALLVLWQVGMIGEAGGAATPGVGARFRELIERLREQFGAEREALLYEASPYPGARSAAALFRLGDADLPTPSPVSTLCVPADTTPPIDVEARGLIALSRC